MTLSCLFAFKYSYKIWGKIRGMEKTKIYLTLLNGTGYIFNADGAYNNGNLYKYTS